MKTFALFLGLVATLVLFPAHAIKGPYGRSTSLDHTGAAVSSSLEKHFINVINRSGGTLAAGNVVVWDSGAEGDDGARGEGASLKE